MARCQIAHHRPVRQQYSAWRRCGPAGGIGDRRARVALANLLSIATPSADLLHRRMPVDSVPAVVLRRRLQSPGDSEGCIYMAVSVTVGPNAHTGLFRYVGRGVSGRRRERCWNGSRGLLDRKTSHCHLHSPRSSRRGYPLTLANRLTISHEADNPCGRARHCSVDRVWGPHGGPSDRSRGNRRRNRLRPAPAGGQFRSDTDLGPGPWPWVSPRRHWFGGRSMPTLAALGRSRVDRGDSFGSPALLRTASS